MTHATMRLLDRETGAINLMSPSETGTSGPHKDERAHRGEERHEFQEAAFAGELVQTLDKARQDGKFDDLVLVASPHFLGVLRQKLNGPLEKSVVQSISKNLVNESESVIHQNIFN